MGQQKEEHPSEDGKLTGTNPDADADLPSQVSAKSWACRAQLLRPYCCSDYNLAAAGMLHRRLEREWEEMVGRYAKRNPGKDRRMNLLVLELEGNLRL